MKYAFVSLSIIAIWIAIILIVIFLDYNEITLPIVALLMTLVLFFIGFRSKK